MKTIKINLYSPKELWIKFWNKFYWPRRKQCAEWIDLLKVRLEDAIIIDIIINGFYNKGLMGDDLAESLELAIRSAIKNNCDDFKKVINQPMD